MNHHYKICKNLESFFLKLGNHGKSSTKYTYKLVAFDPGNAGYGVSESPIFQNFPGGACPRTPLYNLWNRA